MKTVIFVILCTMVYLIIGFGVLVLRARTHFVNTEDTVLALLLWPVIVVLYILYNMAESIRNSAQTLGNKLDIRMKRMKK